MKGKIDLKSMNKWGQLDWKTNVKIYTKCLKSVK